ncbi:hypothetical protein OHA77_15005 [Streptosporangium sp. NBC_01639]|uniref:hypothetical protein n=1 Tax=Streptosporangium sp. NBC_01639 TaxID=2975948 RepID=UPI0038679E11|nr:hypothetical protein OHA77_15005 [Streptosporangium sp. NBC_01639]
MGDFNDWDPYAHPMRPQDGLYRVSLTMITDQSACFRYLADGGVWFDDVDADHHDTRGGHLRPTPARPDPDPGLQVGRARVLV